jgi:hypothetical protein
MTKIIRMKCWFFHANKVNHVRGEVHKLNVLSCWRKSRKHCKAQFKITCYHHLRPIHFFAFWGASSLYPIKIYIIYPDNYFCIYN